MLPALPAGWDVSDPVLLSDGIGGKVWRVRLANGRSAALKQASVAALEDLDGATSFLKWIDGDGAVRLIDEQGRLALLEWAGERTLRAHLEEHGDDAATAIAAEVMQRLHSPRKAPAPGCLTSLTDNFASLFTCAEADRVQGGRSHFVETAEVAASLLENQRNLRVLHGDIHHENILLGPRGWLAIDPKGLVGDPAYDAANMFQNPVHYPLRETPARILSIACVLAEALGREVETVIGYAFAYSGLSTAWWLQDGNMEAANSTLAIGKAIGEAMRQVRS